MPRGGASKFEDQRAAVQVGSPRARLAAGAVGTLPLTIPEGSTFLGTGRVRAVPPRRRSVRAGPRDEGLRRDVGFMGLLWISTGTTLGSGWLFGAFVALTIAGPSVLIAWVIASVIMIAAGPHPRRAGRDVPAERGDRTLPGSRLRQPGRRDLRLVLLRPGGDHRSDRGTRRHPVPVDRLVGPRPLQRAERVPQPHPGSWSPSGSWSSSSP